MQLFGSYAGFIELTAEKTNQNFTISVRHTKEKVLVLVIMMINQKHNYKIIKGMDGIESVGIGNMTTM